MDFQHSIAQHAYPNESTLLCSRCGDSLQLHNLGYSEIIDRIRDGYSASADRAEHQKRLDEAHLDMIRLETELQRLKDLQKELERQKGFVEACIGGFRSMQSPVRKVPQELLVEIFKNLCCGEAGVNLVDGIRYDRDQAVHMYSIKSPTLTLSRVCARWYSLVMSTPVLWSSFGVDMLRLYPASFINTFLQRSRSHPIDIVFQMGLDFPPESLLPFIESSNRWHSAVFRGAQSAAFRRVLQSVNAGGRGIPELVSLSLRGTEGYIDALFFPVDCPKLQSLTLHGLYLDLKHPQMSITQLVLFNLDSKHAALIIDRCPNVQDLMVKNFRYPDSVYPLVENNAFPKVCNAQKLTVAPGYTQNSFPLATFTQRVDLPMLTHLQLLDWTNYFDPFHIHNLDLVLPDSLQLTHLTLHHTTFRPDVLLKLFKSLPHISTLEIEEEVSGMTSVCLILKSLVLDQVRSPIGTDRDKDWRREEDMDVGYEEEEGDWNGNEDDKLLEDIPMFRGVSLLPKLQILNLTTIWPDNKLMLELVHSRWKPLPFQNAGVPDLPVSLQKIHLRYLGQTPRGVERLRKSLEPFEKEGMDIEIVQPRIREEDLL